MIWPSDNILLYFGLFSFKHRQWAKYGFKIIEPEMSWKWCSSTPKDLGQFNENIIEDDEGLCMVHGYRHARILMETEQMPTRALKGPNLVLIQIVFPAHLFFFFFNHTENTKIWVQQSGNRLFANQHATKEPLSKWPIFFFRGRTSGYCRATKPEGGLYILSHHNKDKKIALTKGEGKKYTNLVYSTHLRIWAECLPKWGGKKFGLQKWVLYKIEPGKAGR